MQSRYSPEKKRAVHFVGFRGDEYFRAIKVFGTPDFIHRNNDTRVLRGGEIAPCDRVVYANGCELKEPSPFAFNDSEVF